jgi:hypothetical protein
VAIKAEDILESLPVEQRPEFAKRLKSEAGVQVSFTVAGQGRKRKHRWGSAQGKVVAVRLTDAEYASVSGQAAGAGLSPGLYLRRLATQGYGIGEIVPEIVPSEFREEMSRRAQKLNVSIGEWAIRQAVIRLRGKLKRDAKRRLR